MCVNLEINIVRDHGEAGTAHPAKMDLNKKWSPKQKTIQNFNIDAKGFRKTRNKNPPTREIRVTSYPMSADLPMVGRSASTG